MKEIVITVRGGVAEVIYKPRGVKVIIVDYDNDPMGNHKQIYEKEEELS